MLVLWQAITSSCGSEQGKEASSSFLKKVLIQSWALCSHSLITSQMSCCPNNQPVYIRHKYLG